MNRLAILVVSLFALNCTGEDVDVTMSALDANQSGAVDCADLHHVLACIHHADSHACAHADVNGDGVVDDTDAHDTHAALVAAHHDCAPPDHHDPDGHHAADHAGDHGGGHQDDGHHDGAPAADHHTDVLHDQTGH